MKWNVLILAFFALLAANVTVFAEDDQDVETDTAQTPDDAQTASANYTEVGYAACRGVISYGGKLIAVWFVGSNPATATVVLVGLAGGKIAGYGFDAVANYLRSQNITPPTEAEIIHLMDEFEMLEEEDEDGDDIPEIDLDEQGQVRAFDQQGNVVEVDIIQETPQPQPELPSYMERAKTYLRHIAYTGTTTTTAFIHQLPRMGTTTITGTLAGMVAQLVGGEAAAAATNAAVNNLTGQVYDMNVLVLNEEADQDEDNAGDEDNTPPRVIMHVDTNNLLEEIVIFEDYPNRIPAANAEANVERLTTESNLGLETGGLGGADRYASLMGGSFL